VQYCQQQHNPAIEKTIQEVFSQYTGGQGPNQELTNSITKSILQGFEDAKEAKNPTDAIKATLDAALANQNLPRENVAAVQGIVDATLSVIKTVAESNQVAQSKKVGSYRPKLVVPSPRGSYLHYRAPIKPAPYSSYISLPGRASYIQTNHGIPYFH